MSALIDFRKLKDDFFSKDEGSPLSVEQKRDFKGLNYFAQNPQLQIQARIEKFQTKETIQMETSTGESQAYQRYGRLMFEIGGQPVELTLYHSSSGFFLPFIDGLAGKETYPAGRYLEPEQTDKGTFILDFNLAYNPYCAYNENWSCPLTPAENRLKVPIHAGEKLFHT